ncbi:hypothetical protein Syun_000472 [Stephania yunnanensis]|uniref:Uncharacterized protein n=1 Tax=Stephania yunnanensis TaxID=152371 RepID=A0AAP0LDR2_9MAGN
MAASEARKSALSDPRREWSFSKAINETVNGSHQFVIKGYSLAKGMGPGKYLASEIFSVGGYDWAIYFYPDGKNPEESPGYVSVFIALVSDGADVRALFELTLLDQSGKGKDKVHSHFGRGLETGPYTLKYKGSMWGYKRFFKRQSLETSDFLKDDCLSMRCTVGVVQTRTEGPKPYVSTIPPSNMDQDLKELLDSGIGSDITFKVGEHCFKAHKLVLAARSSVFEAQFYGTDADRNLDEIEMEDVEPSIFTAMLKFIYSDELPDTHEIVGFGLDRLEQLLVAADRFGLDRLKILCEAKLGEEITTDTVATTLALAVQHNCTQLKTVCLKFAAAPGNLAVVMQSEGFRYLEQGHASLLSELLETIAEVDEEPTLSRKRSTSTNIDLNFNHSIDGQNGDSRRLQRRL